MIMKKTKDILCSTDPKSLSKQVSPRSVSPIFFISSNFKLLESQLKSKFYDIQNLETTIQIFTRICLAETNFLIRKEKPLVECFYAVVLLVWPPWHQIWAVCSQRTKRTWHPYTRGSLSGPCTCEMWSGQNLPFTKGNFARFLWWLTITSLLCQTTVTPVVVIHLTDADAVLIFQVIEGKSQS